MHIHRGYTPTPMCLSVDAAPTQSCPSSILPIPWQVVETYECDRGTFVYSVTLLDRYLARKAVPLSELQLLGCACFLVATKTIGPAAFQMPLLAHVTDGTCDPSSIRVRSTRGTCISPSLPLQCTHGLMHASGSHMHAFVPPCRPPRIHVLQARTCSSALASGLATLFPGITGSPTYIVRSLLVP